MVTLEKKIRIKATQYTKRYGETTVFENLNLEIKDGEFVCIIGPNGCGKSTLIKSIAGLLPHKGRLKTDGLMSLVGQNQDEMLLPWLSLESNIVFPRKRHDIDQQLLLNLLSATKLNRYTNHYPYQLSGGMQQLALIARALLHQSSIILLDEPFKSLDFHMSKMMQLKMLELWNRYKPTILMVSHDIDEAIFLADKILIFSDKPARIKKVINVTLPRERDMQIVATNAFTAIKKEIIHELTI